MSNPEPAPPDAIRANTQESVWDYPRPPRVEPTSKQIQVVFNGMQIADTRRAQRVLETSHPPVYYLLPDDIVRSCFRPVPDKSSFCEWKGVARYFDIVVGDRVAPAAAWSYPDPTPEFAVLKDYVAVYCALMESCRVNGEPARAQPGSFYGGWITSDIVGPFKGG